MDGTAISEPTAEEGWEWALVEIMGHRTHWGRAREVERFGTKMLRVDVPTVIKTPAPEGGESTTEVTWSTHFYGGSSIFSFTLTDEATVMKRNAPYLAPHRLTYREPEPEEVAPSDDDNEFD